MTEVLIRAAGLGKHYGGDENAIRVLENLDLEIRRAERVAIVGESGVGKSTLLHILGTLDRPSEGKVFLDEQDLFALPELELAALRKEFLLGQPKKFAILAEGPLEDIRRLQDEIEQLTAEVAAGSRAAG